MTFLNGFTIGKIRDEVGQAGWTLLSLVSPDENRVVLRIIMAVEAMLQFTIHFPDEVVWEKDSFFRDSPEKLLFPVPDFIKYFSPKYRSIDEGFAGQHNLYVLQEHSGQTRRLARLGVCFA